MSYNNKALSVPLRLIYLWLISTFTSNGIFRPYQLDESISKTRVQVAG